jgi:Bacterial PH domain
VSDDHFEPVYGLPGYLPAGEHVLWQGSPEWRALALRAYRVREVIAYFVLLLALEAIHGLGAGEPLLVTAKRLIVPALLGALACAVLGLIAYVSARTTVYTVTNRRLAIRTGIALTATINLPFRLIHAVDVAERRGGEGEVVLRLDPAERVSYVVCWPSVRPWHYAHPQPALRCIADARAVGELLAAAVADPLSRVTVRRHAAAAAPDRPGTVAA